MKPILITGGAGLIGNAVALQLAASGKPVLVIDVVGGLINGVNVQECDVRDAHALHAIARDGLSGLIHCGGFSGAMVAGDRPYAMFEVNIQGTANVLEVARIHGANRVVYCSSTSAYGQTGGDGIEEGVALQPTTMYAASKAAGEMLVRAYAAQFGIVATSLRISWVYGPRRTTDCFIRNLICDGLNGAESQVGLPGTYPRQYVHLNDVVRAVVLAYEAPTLPQLAYNITAGEVYSLSSIADVVRKEVPASRVQFGQRRDANDGIQGRFAIEAAKRDLKYTPQVPLESGISSYLQWLLNSSN